jgi:chromate reductase, NAD(P)H dehydrogenase (quinone)
MRILGIAGSLRAGSLNRRLLESAAEYLPLDITDALGAVPLFNEDLERALPPGVRRLREEVRSADGLLIATPEYNHSIPGVLKNALDWLSRPAPDRVLAGKRVAILGVTTGRWGTRLAQAHLRQVLTATECVVMPAPAIYAAGGEIPADSLVEFMAAFRRWIGGGCSPSAATGIVASHEPAR